MLSRERFSAESLTVKMTEETPSNEMETREKLLLEKRKDLSSPDEFAAEEHPEAEDEHVVGRLPIVIHRVQRHGHVRMTIVTAEIVLKSCKDK